MISALKLTRNFSLLEHAADLPCLSFSALTATVGTLLVGRPQKVYRLYYAFPLVRFLGGSFQLQVGSKSPSSTKFCVSQGTYSSRHFSTSPI